jgi:pimeloyl-ACP methyl ester carboxylesterase
MKDIRSCFAARCSLPLLLFVLVFPPLAGLIAPSAARAEGIQCSTYTIPVHLSALDPTTYHVASWLCYQNSRGSVVQLLVHGATYSHTYWDFTCPSCQTDAYSYVRFMAQAGQTTFAYDRLGDGQSDHPLPELVTIQSDAYVLSQLIGMLKSGGYSGPTFQKVVLVGHSVGSAISVAEAADPGLAHPDAVVLTGFIHFVDPVEVALLGAEIYPAFLDPDPRFRGFLPGYFTTKPGVRGQIFYYLPNADPTVILQDEATKETITDSEFATFFTVESTTLSRQIHVPVLEVLGQYDNLFCLGALDCTNGGDVARYEAPFFSPDAHLQVMIVPQAGHDLALQKQSSLWEGQVALWIASHFS